MGRGLRALGEGLAQRTHGQGFTVLLAFLSQVRGVKGVFLANRKVDGKVVTLITYNKGRDWGHLRPPSEDMNGKPTNCKPVSISARVPALWRGAKDSKVTDGDVHAGSSDGQEARGLSTVGRVTGNP